MRQEPGRTTLEVDNEEGRVMNVLTYRSEGEIELMLGPLKARAESQPR